MSLSIINATLFKISPKLGGFLTGNCSGRGHLSNACFFPTADVELLLRECSNGAKVDNFFHAPTFLDVLRTQRRISPTHFGAGSHRRVLRLGNGAFRSFSLAGPNNCQNRQALTCLFCMC